MDTTTAAPTTFAESCDGCVYMLYAQAGVFSFVILTIIIGMILYTKNRFRHPLNKRYIAIIFN